MRKKSHSKMHDVLRLLKIVKKITNCDENRHCIKFTGDEIGIFHCGELGKANIGEMRQEMESRVVMGRKDNAQRQNTIEK